MLVPAKLAPEFTATTFVISFSCRFACFGLIMWKASHDFLVFTLFSLLIWGAGGYHVGGIQSFSGGVSVPELARPVSLFVLASPVPHCRF